MATNESSTDQILTQIRDAVLSNNETLSDLKSLLRTSVIIELWRSGLKQQEIAERLGVGKKAVNDVLKGISRPEQVN